MKTILFVCSGNTCRSPMAQALLRRRLDEEGLSGLYDVQSAGLGAAGGMPASDNARRAMREKGLDISGHRSQNAGSELLKGADTVLAMSAAHLRAIRAALGGDAHLLLEYALGIDADVEDPYGGSLDEYRRCAAVLEDAVEGVVKRLQRG